MKPTTGFVSALRPALGTFPTTNTTDIALLPERRPRPNAGPSQSLHKYDLCTSCYLLPSIAPMLTVVTGYAPEKIPYGISRYQNETRRLYRVLDMALGKSKSGFIVGDRLTIADISCWGWVASAS
jgi:glutathione S-transferase